MTNGESGTRFFMSIGSVIRTEGSSPITSEAYARARRHPILLPRQQVRRFGEGTQDIQRGSSR